MNNFNKKAEKLVLEITEYQESASRIPAGPLDPDTHVSATLTDQDISDVIEVSPLDRLNNEIGKIFNHDKKIVGLQGEGYKNLVRLAEGMQNTESLRSTVSIKTLTRLIFSWVKNKYLTQTTLLMSGFVLGECEKLVQEIEIWIPIAWLHIQSDIQLGKITFKTITREMLDQWVSRFPTPQTSEERIYLSQLEEEDRSKFQGFAAATMKVTAESIRAEEFAYEEAERAISLLRFYSPANASPRLVSYCTLMGKEHVESKNHLQLQDGRITNISNSAASQAEPSWRIGSAKIAEMKTAGLNILNAWLLKGHLSKFERKLIDSLILYSKSSLAQNPTDKLIYLLVSLESILLKNASEPIQDNLGLRIALSIGRDVEERKRIISNTKQIYNLRSSFIHHGSYLEIDSAPVLAEFMIDAWDFFQWLIGVVNSGLTIEQFFEELENKKLSF